MTKKGTKVGTAYITRGLPGSGKTLLTNEYLSKLSTTSTAVCSADHFFEKLGEYRKMFNPNRLPEAHAYCLDNYMEQLRDGVEVVIVDNTNTSAWEIAPYVAIANALCYQPTIVNVPCDPLIAWKRNTRDVPLRVIMEMHRKLQTEQLPPYWDQLYAFKEHDQWRLVP